MATNPYFRHNVRSEQNLYEDLIIESIRMYGQDVYYIPREVVHRDMVFDDSIYNDNVNDRMHRYAKVIPHSLIPLLQSSPGSTHEVFCLTKENERVEENQ